jgi:putative membrane protein
MTVVSEGRRPDTQAELANERTYLAWLRTGLALVAAGVAAERILPAEGIIWARQLIGVTLILAGVVTAALARRRWQSVDRALRAGRPIPHPLAGYMVATVIVVDGLATIVLLLRADAG